MKRKLFSNKLWLRVGMLVAIMTTALSGTAWAETWTHAFASPEAISDNSITVDGATWNVSTVTKTGSPTIDKGNSYQKYCLKFGSGKNNCYSSITFSTDYFSNYNVQSVTIQVLHNASKSGTFTATQGNTTIGTITQTIGTSWTDLTVNTNEGSGGTLSFTYSPTDCAVNIHSITVTYTTGGGSPTPSISANDVNIEYSATNGSIAYTLSNATGNVTASVEGDWLTLGTITSSAVPFTCSENPGKTARTATITLSYTDASDKVVTVTQAGNPNVVDNISDITAAGTYTVKGTIVAISNRGFVLGDGTGYVYYYEGSGFTPADYSIGDIKKLSGSVTVYGGAFQFGSSTTITAATESNYVAENPTVLTGSQMDTRVASTTPAQLSTYVQYEGVLSVSGTYYNITSIDGASTAKGSISYPISTDFTSLSGKTVKVTGYYVGVSSSQYYNTMLGSIEEVTNADPVISASNVTLAYDATSGEITYTIANPTDATLTATSSASWISNITVGEESVTFTTTANNGTTDREAKITLSYTGAEDVTVTVTQGHYVADYATLPFEFNGGRADIEDTAGLTQEGLGSDYKNSPYLKLDETGDYVLLKINERPGVLTFDIQGNSFSGGTFTVQTSEDGMTYTDLETYTELGSTQSEEFNNLGENVRYIKWVYTTKSSGNVALGNITLAKYVEPSTPTVAAGTLTNVTINSLWNGDLDDITLGDGVEEGTLVYFSLNVETGYTLQSVTVLDADNGEVPLTEATDSWYFTMPSSSVTINATATESSVTPTTGEKYVKVTSTDDITDGQYLIVYETDGIAFNGGLGTLDAVSNTIDVTINNSEIVATTETKAAEFTIAAIEGGYSIKSASGQYIYHSGTRNGLSSSDEAQANDITFDEDGNVLITVGDYTLKYNKNSDQTRFRYFGSGQQSIQLYKFVAAPASQSVKVTSAGYATIVAEADLEIPENVEVYAVTVGESASSAQLTEVTDGVPAGDAVLVKASEGTYEFAYASTTPDAIAENDLKASDGTVTGASGNIYALGNKTKGVGFYKVGESVTIPAGKAYLEVTTTPSNPESGVKAFYGFEDDATGIEEIQNSQFKNQNEDAAIYDLSGRHLSNRKLSNGQMPRGIYIVGGKKILY